MPILRFSIFAITFLLCVSSCRETAVEPKLTPTIKTASETRDVLPQWWTPVQLQGVKTPVLVADYLTSNQHLTEVELALGLTTDWKPQADTVWITISGDIGALSMMTWLVDGREHTILLKAPEKQPVTLRLKDQNYSTVAVKGEMNAWNTKLGAAALNNGIWSVDFLLRPGRYQYQFVVDGREMLDPKNPNKVSNGQGGFNSQLVLKGSDRDERPKIWFQAVDNDQLSIGRNRHGAIFAFWENQLLEVTDTEGDLWEITIPAVAKAQKRSFIRVFSQNEAGAGNDLLIPLHYGEVVTSTDKLDRHDREFQQMYFVLVDRFNNGNLENDAPVQDERVLPMANYLGGDLDGITAKIESGYFRKLGINSLWLSPITQNPEGAYQEYPEPHRWYTGYHGYWPILSAKVDHRFGDAAAMQRLVDAAHKDGINVLLDYVCNHVHEEHPIYKNHPEYATNFTLPNGEKNIRIWEEERLTTWFDAFLPTLDLENETVIDLQIDSTMYWLKKYGLDGFRHDASKHIALPFWRKLTKRLKEEVILTENRPIYQIGETYGSRELINTYISSGLLDAQFDFGLYFDAREVFARGAGNMPFLVNSLNESFSYFGKHNTMGYISGNHDQARFISLAGGDLKFDEDHREAGWAREVGVGNPIGYDRLLQQIAFNLTIPGVPVLYYGDEIGMPGASDPDSRRMMRFGVENLGEREQEHIIAVRKLSEFRKNRISLIYGETEIIHSDEQTLVLLRQYLDEVTLVAFNSSEVPQKISFTLPGNTPPGKLKRLFGKSIPMQNGKSMNLTLAPASTLWLGN